MTSATEPEERMKRIVREIWNVGNLNTADELVSDEYVMRNPTLDLDAEGPEGLKNVVRTFRSSFPDLDVTIDDLVTQDDTVALRYTIEGTHQGDFLGIPPTGTEIEAHAMTMVRFEGGRAVEEWVLYDVLGMMQQFGIAPAPQYFEQ